MPYMYRPGIPPAVGVNSQKPWSKPMAQADACHIVYIYEARVVEEQGEGWSLLEQIAPRREPCKLFWLVVGPNFQIEKVLGKSTVSNGLCSLRYESVPSSSG